MSTKETYSKLTERFLSALRDGKSPWENAAIKSALPKNHKTSVAYKGFNRLALSILPYGVAEYMTFNQGRDKKMFVKKGEKGTHLLKYHIIHIHRETGKSITEEAYKALSESGKAAYKDVPMVNSFTVFNLMQFDGADDLIAAIETTRNERKKQLTFEMILRGWFKTEGISVHEGSDKTTFTKSGEVYVPAPWQFDNMQDHYSALASAAILSTTTRLDWDGDNAWRELVAGIGAAFLCDTAGADASSIFKYSTENRKIWIESISANPKYLIDAARQAEKAADLVASRIDLSVAGAFFQEENKPEKNNFVAVAA